MTKNPCVPLLLSPVLPGGLLAGCGGVYDPADVEAPAGVGTALASSAAVSRFALCAPLLPLWALALVVTWAVLVERAVDFLREVEKGGLSPCS